jgi:hypothetical protein
VIATPSNSGDRRSRQVALAGVLLAAWLLPAGTFWAAARLSGGDPRPDVWNWPTVAMVGYLHHQPPLPWAWVGAPRVDSPLRFYVLCALAALLLAVAGVVAVTVLQGGLIAWFPGLVRRPASPPRATPGQLQQLLVRGPQAGRMVVGYRGRSLIATAPGASLLVFGPAGSGKTSSFCVPIIQEWAGPVVAAGLGPELVTATAGVRQRRGRVEIWDPAGVTGSATCSWSPTAGCRSFDVACRTADCMAQAWDLARRRGQDVSYTAPNAILAVSLWAAAHGGDGVEDIRGWMQDPSWGRLQAAVGRVPGARPRASQCLATLAALSEDDRARYSGVVLDLLPADDALSRPPPGGAELDAAELLTDDQATLYVVAPAERQAGLGALLPGILGSVLDEALRLAAASPARALPARLLVVLDGCGDVAPVRDLAQHLAIGGDLNMTFLVTFRDLAQVQEGYGGLAEDVIGSARGVVSLGTQQDTRTDHLIRDLAQRHAVDVGAAGSAFGDPMAPEFTRLLGPGQGVLLHGDLPPVPLWSRPWFATRRLVELVDTQPYIVGVTRVHAGIEG